MKFDEEAAFGDHGPPINQNNKSDIDRFLASFECKLIGLIPIFIFGTFINTLLGLQGNLLTWAIIVFITGTLWYKIIHMVREVRIRTQVEKAVQELTQDFDRGTGGEESKTK